MVTLLLPNDNAKVGPKSEVLATLSILKHPNSLAFLSKPLAVGKDGRLKVAPQFNKKQTLILKARLPPMKGIEQSCREIKSKCI